MADRLAAGGFVAAEEEAAELVVAAGGDPALLEALIARRLTGEPLAWITGTVRFCGLDVRVDPGVYVPRWQSEVVAERAVSRLPRGGVAVDLCTGCGAVAAVLAARRPGARVVATEVGAEAVACASANGVEVFRGDLFAPLPRELRGLVDVVTGVVPYVPTGELPLLQRDTFTFETPLAYDGGADGTAVLRRVVAESAAWLRRGGALVLELGGDQADLLAEESTRCGFGAVERIVDEDGDVRGIEATLSGS